jgi:FkbM family methyltransferase
VPPLAKLPLLVLRRLRRAVAPTLHEREIRRYWAAGGDEAFRYAYELDPGSVVLDVGGYEGGWAAELLDSFDCRVHVFEPVASYVDNLNRRFAFDSRVTVHACGLGGETRDILISLAGDASSHVRTHEGTKPEKARIIDVSEWWAENDIDRVALMKVNIEGGEYELVPRLIETGLIDRVDNLQVQFHDFAPDAEARMNQIASALSRTHDRTYGFAFVWENWRRREPLNNA